MGVQSSHGQGMDELLVRKDLDDLVWLVMCMGQQFRRLLLVICRQLRPSEVKGQLFDSPGEMERHLVTVVHRRTGIATNVEALVDGHGERNRGRDRLSGVLLAIHRQYARATFAKPRAGVFEVKDNGVLARLERGSQPVFGSHAALPTKLLEC